MLWWLPLMPIWTHWWPETTPGGQQQGPAGPSRGQQGCCSAFKRRTGKPRPRQAVVENARRALLVYVRHVATRHGKGAKDRGQRETETILQVHKMTHNKHFRNIVNIYAIYCIMYCMGRFWNCRPGWKGERMDLRMRFSFWYQSLVVVVLGPAGSPHQNP